MKKLLNKNWRLVFDDKNIPANVPGDITIDLFNAGLVDDPYFADNYKKSEWIQRKDFVYSLNLYIDEETYKEDVIDLEFKGIDLFADVYINKTLVGNTKNMFLKYVFSIKDYLKIGKNVIQVKMHSTLNEMDTYDCTGYSSIFNDPRIFVRKAQCHFGWDWAPKICAYGIWDDVILNAHPKYQISSIQVVSDIEGNVSLFSEINYNTLVLRKPDGSIAIPAEEKRGDTLRFSISKGPNKKEFIVKEIEVSGQKSFCNFKVDNPKLWWPIGYGKQPLYHYKVELIRDNKVMDIKEGRFAFRKVELKEQPVGDDLLGFKFYINNQPIYIKGSNWVPIECFTGVVKDEKYDKITDLAVNANINMLRVWGGGIYEKDIFYDLCDEKGILVWQDIMFACADIPEDKPDFVKNVLDEVEYQVKRLRNHPSLIYWCGGNEKTGCYGLCISHGDFFVNNILNGFIRNLDSTREYRRQSPFSHTDIGNDKTSGESHAGRFEDALITGLNNYRKSLNDLIVPFVSECAVMGPSSIETLKKIFPNDHLWPMDDMWKDRFMENPYGSVPMDFPHREMKYANDLYGECNSLEEFVPKAMMAHQEAYRAEVEYARFHSDINSGIMNWMYSDIWPSGTWATIDYYLEPKAIYYRIKDVYKGLLISFSEDKDGVTNLFVSNQTLRKFENDVDVYVKDYEGHVLDSEKYHVKVMPDKVVRIPLKSKNIGDNIYLTAVCNNEKTIYSPSFFAHKKFAGEYEYKVKQLSSKSIEVIVEAKSFIRFMFLHFKDNYKYIYSDNYFDMEKGDEKHIIITSKSVIKPEELMIEVYKG